MKTRTSNKTEEQASTCCGPTNETVEKNDPCCDQPSDGSSCCDKSETKEVNAEQTGCC